MKTLDEILNEYAINQGFEDYLDYCNSLTLSDGEWEDIARSYAFKVAQQALQDAAKNAKIIFIDGKTKEQTSHLMLYSGAHCMMPDTDLILKTEIKLP